MNPIILVPGVGGTKLTYQYGNERDMAWIHPTSDKGALEDKAANNIWGQFDPATDKYTSYVEPENKIDIIQNSAGSYRLFEWNVLSQAVVKLLLNFTYYLDDLLSFFIAQGYEVGKDLFSFSFDWRQSSVQVATSFKQFLGKVQRLNNGKKCVCVGHSLGGVVINTFMKVCPTWSSYICKFVALTVPFDGSSGISSTAPIHGYPLAENFMKPVTGRGGQANSGVMADLAQQPMGLAPTQMIFTFQSKKKREQSMQDCERLSQIYMKRSPEINQVSEVVLNKQVYKNKLMDVGYKLLEKIVKRPDLLRIDRDQWICRLARSCKQDSVTVNSKKAGSLGKLFVQDAFAPEYRVPNGQIADDSEVTGYHIWAGYNKNNCMLVTTRKYEGIKQVDRVQFKNLQSMRGTGVDLLHKAIINQHSSENQSMQILFPKLHEKLIKKEFREKSTLELMNDLTPEGSMERIMFGPEYSYWEKQQEMNSEINFAGVDDFQFLSFAGFGQDTRNTAVYYEELENNYEINFLKPQYTIVDGDGTVLLTSALADNIPDKYVSDRILVKCSHAGILNKKSVFNIMLNFARGRELEIAENLTTSTTGEMSTVERTVIK